MDNSCPCLSHSFILLFLSLLISFTLLLYFFSKRISRSMNCISFFVVNCTTYQPNYNLFIKEVKDRYSDPSNKLQPKKSLFYCTKGWKYFLPNFRILICEAISCLDKWTLECPKLQAFSIKIFLKLYIVSLHAFCHNKRSFKNSGTKRKFPPIFSCYEV